MMYPAVLNTFILASFAFGNAFDIDNIDVIVDVELGDGVLPDCSGGEIIPLGDRCECCNWVDPEQHNDDAQVGTITQQNNFEDCREHCLEEEQAEYFRFRFAAAEPEKLGNCRCYDDDTDLQFNPQRIIGTSSGSLDGGLIFGDPHIMKWNKEKYDFHGECDLVLFQAPDYAGGLGLDVHIRTTIENFYSYVEEVAIKAGSFVANVNKDGVWVDSDKLSAFPAQNGPFRVIQKVRKDKEGKPVALYEILVDGKEALHVRIPGSKFVFVKVINRGGRFFNATDREAFGSSTGLMGQFGTGKTLGRDGVTEFDDMDKFGMEWQVKPYEEMLFLNSREPQAPRACKMPPKRSDVGRKLRENPQIKAKAKAACSHVGADLFELCVQDVIGTGDASIAEGY